MLGSGQASGADVSELLGEMNDYRLERGEVKAYRLHPVPD